MFDAKVAMNYREILMLGKQAVDCFYGPLGHGKASNT